jgi:hypothetical protein
VSSLERWDLVFTLTSLKWWRETGWRRGGKHTRRNFFLAIGVLSTQNCMIFLCGSCISQFWGKNIPVYVEIVVLCIAMCHLAKQISSGRCIIRQFVIVKTLRSVLANLRWLWSYQVIQSHRIIIYISHDCISYKLTKMLTNLLIRLIRHWLICHNLFKAGFMRYILNTVQITLYYGWVYEFGMYKSYVTITTRVKADNISITPKFFLVSLGSNFNYHF